MGSKPPTFKSIIKIVVRTLAVITCLCLTSTARQLVVSSRPTTNLRNEQTKTQQFDQSQSLESGLLGRISQTCNRLDFSKAQRSTAFKLLSDYPELKSRVRAPNKSGSLTEIETHDNTTEAKLTDESESQQLERRLLAKIEALATQEQVAGCAAYESLVLIRSEIFANHTKSLCNNENETDILSIASRKYVELMAEHFSRELRYGLDLDRDQRLVARELLEESLGRFILEHRDLFCALYKNFPMEQPGVELLTEPRYCELQLPILKQIPDAAKEIETKLLNILDLGQQNILRQGMINYLDGCRVQIRSMKAVVKSNKNSKNKK